MTRSAPGPVLVTGANGFIGSALAPHLRRTGLPVRRGVRRSGADTVRFDADDPAAMVAALSGCTSAFWLVHGLKRGAGYAEWEAGAARAFVQACAAAGTRRVIYLGGPDPGPNGSMHLRARLRTGEVLRQSGGAAGLDVVELRAAMILGAGSDSFRLARDVALRLPVLVATPWMQTRQAPVAVDDVLVALQAALALPPGIYDVPGPETITGLELMRRLKRAAGVPAKVVRAGFDGRQAAAPFAGLLTRVDRHLARELVEGMGHGDLTGSAQSVWQHLPHHSRVGVDQALRRALATDDPGLRALLVEGVMGALAKRAWGRP